MTMTSDEPRRLPPDIIPPPRIILFGCQPFVPRPPIKGPCHCCKGRIGQPRKPDFSTDPPGLQVDPCDDRTVCGWCHAMTPRNELKARNGRRRLSAREELRENERDATRGLEKRTKKVCLSEVERRRLWNGYKGGFLEPNAKVTNRAKIGREWLKQIGQEPDWSLCLDKHGRAIPKTSETKEPSQ